jgi:hypothetical protein
MKKTLSLVPMAALALFLFGNQAFAQCPPPVGGGPINCGPASGAILDLNGQLIPHTYQNYTAAFTAVDGTTDLSFAFREDPAFEFLDDVTVTDTTTSTAVTLVNGDFELGPVGANAPTGWTYLNTDNATFPGIVENVAGDAHGGTNYYFDGSVQAYDGITQALTTTVGDNYTVSFWLMDNSGLTNWSRLSTNGDVTDTGGNGADVLVYAGGIPNLVTTPEPDSLALLCAGLGLLGFAGFARRRKSI